MSGHLHGRSSEIAAFLAGERALVSNDQLVLAFHLAIGCEPCWRALDVAKSSGVRWPAPRVADRPQRWRIPFLSCSPESRPLLSALRRIVAPARTWAVLSSQHIEAVRRVREETWGFARLLIDEAEVLIEEAPLALPGGFERLLTLSRRLVKLLNALEPWCRVGADLHARLELVRAHGSIYECPERTSVALERARSYLQQGTGSADLQVDLRLSHARHAFYRGDVAGHIRDDVDQSLSLLQAGEHLRRLEVILAGVRYQELNDFSRSGDTRHLRSALVKCLRSERELRFDSDPVRRLSGLIRLAELAISARLVAEIRLGRRPYGVPALAAFAGVVEAHLDEINGDVDPSIERIQRAIAFLRTRTGAPIRLVLGPPAVGPAAGGSPFFSKSPLITVAS